jgi:hypothetical protein
MCTLTVSIFATEEVIRSNLFPGPDFGCKRGHQSRTETIRRRRAARIQEIIYRRVQGGKNGLYAASRSPCRGSGHLLELWEPWRRCHSGCHVHGVPQPRETAVCGIRRRQSLAGDRLPERQGGPSGVPEGRPGADPRLGGNVRTILFFQCSDVCVCVSIVLDPSLLSVCVFSSGLLQWREEWTCIDCGAGSGKITF